MLPRRKWLRIVAAGAFAAIVAAGLIWWRVLDPAQARATTPAPQLGDSVQRARTNDYVDVLVGETLADSVGMLLESQQHLDWGFLREGRKGAHRNWEQIVGNRRCRKVLAQLWELPMEERSRECERHFDMLLARHAAAFEAAARHAEDPAAPENTQSLLSTQVALGTILLATAQAGNHELLCRQFRALEEQRQFVARRFVRENIEPSFAGWSRSYATPDLRCQLNVLRELARGMNDAEQLRRIDDVCRDLTVRNAYVDAWDSHSTWIDVWQRRNNAPLDATHGVETYTSLDWPVDLLFQEAKQQQLLNEVAAIVGVTGVD